MLIKPVLESFCVCQQTVVMVLPNLCPFSKFYFTFVGFKQLDDWCAIQLANYTCKTSELWMASWNFSHHSLVFHWKSPWCWEKLKAGGGDDRGWESWMASPTQRTWFWANSGSWRWTGRPGVLQSWGRKGLDTTEWLNWTERTLLF